MALQAMLNGTLKECTKLRLVKQPTVTCNNLLVFYHYPSSHVTAYLVGQSSNYTNGHEECLTHSGIIACGMLCVCTLYVAYRCVELMESIFETMNWSFLGNEIFLLGTVLIQTSSKHTCIYCSFA